MALTIHVEGTPLAVGAGRGGALVFRGAGYFLQVGRRRFSLPRWLTSGALAVSHGETGPGRFVFVLDVTHPWFGTLILQVASFRDST